MRRTFTVPVLILIFILIFAAPVWAGDIVFTAPGFLNGYSAYLYNGSCGLGNLSSDAARSAVTDADIAILSGNTVISSLGEGDVSWSELQGAISPFAGDLVLTELTSGELTSLLNQQMVQGSELFPQISGIHLLAMRKLTDQGDFCGSIERLYLGGAMSDVATDILHRDMTLKVVTTEYLYDAYQMSREKKNLNISLPEAMAAYLAELPQDEITRACAEERIQIAGDTLNVPLLMQQLLLKIPSRVVCDLTTPDIIPDAAVFTLSGQSRLLTCRFPLNEIPYSLSLTGSTIRTPANVNTEIQVTQELPPGRKTANMFDDDTVFVDLSRNDTVPEGSLVTADLSGIYPSDAVLFLYYYDVNGDILPMPGGSQTAIDGQVTFPVSPSTTYIINSRQLNRSVGPLLTPDHPYIPGIIVCVLAFAAWLALILVAQRQRRRKNTATAKNGVEGSSSVELRPSR